MRPTPAAEGPSAASRQFSAETMGELLRALRARSVDHPESPALIACWHYTLIRGRTRDGCFRAFSLNHWVGFTVFAGVVADGWTR